MEHLLPENQWLERLVSGTGWSWKSHPAFRGLSDDLLTLNVESVKNGIVKARVASTCVQNKDLLHCEAEAIVKFWEEYYTWAKDRLVPGHAHYNIPLGVFYRDRSKPPTLMYEFMDAWVGGIFCTQGSVAKPVVLKIKSYFCLYILLNMKPSL